MFRWLTLAFVLTASMAQAAPLTFGTSWDGNPPGTLADITGLTGFQTGLSFGAGDWQISTQGGYSDWFDRDIVGVDGQTLCAGDCTVANNYDVTMADTWTFWATTPSYINGHQFAFKQTSATTWAWGLEDIILDKSDADFQDVFGRLTYLPQSTPLCTLCNEPTPNVPTPVPEPSLCILTGLLLAGIAWRYAA